MANVLFPFGKQALLDGSIVWGTDDIRGMLVRSTYTYDGTDEFVSDLGSVDNGRSVALASKTSALGVADAADTTITATAAVACNAIVLFKYNAADASARLLAYIDTPTSGLPFTPAASQVVPITFNASGIFAL
jgi:hypothetical protein